MPECNGRMVASTPANGVGDRRRRVTALTRHEGSKSRNRSAPVPADRMVAVAKAAAVGVKSSRLGAVAVLAAVFIWGFTNTLIKLSPQPALAFALYRLWMGSLLLLAVSAVTGKRLTRRIIRSSAPGGVLLGVEIVFFFSAIKHTSIADVAVISGSSRP